MAAVPENVASPQPAGNHQRSKSSVIKSFVHRRQPSRGEALVPEPQSAEIQNIPSAAGGRNMGGAGRFAKNNPGALGELQKNQQEAAPRLAPRASRDEPREDTRGRSRSPTKSVLSGSPFKPSAAKDMAKASKSREASPTKSKGLAGFLSRPKSAKNMQSLASDQDSRLAKDKENQAPAEPLELAPPPPIFAQFTSDASVRQRPGRSSVEVTRHTSNQELSAAARPPVKERPKSYQVHPSYQPAVGPQSPVKESKGGSEESSTRGMRTKALNALTGRGRSRTRTAEPSPTTPVSEKVVDPKDIDKHLEAMLDRRNIPEHQRYKMRNLTDTIKMEFIRQDWAEMEAAKGERPGTNGSTNSKEGQTAAADASDGEEEKKRTRGRSFTFSRGTKGKKSGSTSPSKRGKGEGTLGRHFRSRSTDSIASEGPTSPAVSSPGNGLLAKMKLQQGPADYVAYLRKVQKPEVVEVGKLHKLRLLLRNETVAWIEEFIQQGGMEEIVGLLKRIMDVEWREEHEDALLHENLLCLKALATTARGMQYLHTIQADLFPKLLHLLFDPEKKGPSEFTTRGIVTFVLFTYIQSASPAERILRAKSVLQHLRDPEPKEDQRPLAFVMDMRQQRPYRVWNKEVVNVTKEVFWIFLHNLNVVSLPTDKKFGEDNGPLSPPPVLNDQQFAYMQRHFPQERPPVPAAPYVGGVEWDATNYLASHLDLMNAILASIPDVRGRNNLRSELRISGWERCMGGSLRLCKEKFYGSVHDGLRTWVAAAAEDGWDVKDVRYGPPPPESAKTSPKKNGGQQKSAEDAAPKLDMPRLDLGVGQGSSAASPSKAADDGWLS